MIVSVWLRFDQYNLSIFFFLWQTHYYIDVVLDSDSSWVDLQGAAVSHRVSLHSSRSTEGQW